jgi:hypothetical protein
MNRPFVACENVEVGICPTEGTCTASQSVSLLTCEHLPFDRLVRGGSSTRFSDAFGIFATNDDDWFDLTIERDSNFGVDPFLIYQDDSSRWNTAHDHILKFFAVAFDCV